MLQNQTLSAIISSLRAFDLFSDTLDILIISFVFYQLIQFARKSRAGQLVKGIALLILFYGFAVLLDLRTVTWVLNNVVTVAFTAAVVIFQPELRRALERMGQTTVWANRLFGNRRTDPSLRGVWQSAVVAICDAAEQLSDTRTGALMVLERRNNLDEIIRTGTPMHADVIPEMLGTIFYEGTPLHDGAVVIRDGVIVAAGCVLPLSNNLDMGKDMGTRHRAGLGMSENSDAIVVVVSEETGIISLAKNGVLIRRLDRQNLFNLLQEEVVPPEETEEDNESVLKKLLRKGGNAPQGRKSLMDNRVVSILMALACGLATWLVVTIYIDPQGSTTIRDVPINYANSATTYTNQGLDIVERPDISGVTVRVEGNITSIGKMTSSDIMVYPSYSGVSGAGKVTLRLQARVTNTTDYSGNIKCTVEKPYDTIDVVFDEVSEKTVPVTVDASAVSIADGYMLNKTSAVPAEITLRGPTSELDQISQVVAPVLSDDALADTTTTPSTLELRDENGNTITPQYTTMDSDSANVTLTIYQVRELPLEVDFIGVPNGFDTSSLHYTLSQQKLRVAGPARTVSALESLTVTDFDLAREFEMDRDYQRLIELPAGVVSLDGVTNVTLSFNTTDMASTTLNISNIRLVNVPSNYDMEILSSLVSGVELYGPKDEIEELSADSVVAQIDCQSISLTVGQQTIPVTIQIPSSTRIFATGSYTVQCEVTAK